MTEHFLDSHIDFLPDFWRRTESKPTQATQYQAFGYPVEVSANHARLLEGAAISAGRFSSCQPLLQEGRIRLCLAVDSRLPPTDVPAHWPDLLRYYGVGPWLTINAEPWANAFANLEQREGVALLSTSMLDHPYMYSRFIMDSIVLNLLMRNGLGQLHASCVSRDGTAILLSATHNSGKSTTAFRLALAGYRFLSDGMTYVRVGEGGIELLGYPVGEVKLRLDTIDKFPILRGHGSDIMVREGKKVIYNLRRLLPSQVIEGPLRPERLVICLVERTGLPRTRLEPIGLAEAMEELWPEMAHLDERRILTSNLEAVSALLSRATTYRLYLGSDENHILETLSSV